MRRKKTDTNSQEKNTQIQLTWRVNVDIGTKNGENDQEIPQSQTADKPKVSSGRATQQSRDTMKTNNEKQPGLSSPSR